MIVTNLRVPVEDWNQLKAIAAERGMSANQYLNYLMRKEVVAPLTKETKPRMSIWEIPKLAKKPVRGLDLSADDKLTYEE